MSVRFFQKIDFFQDYSKRDGEKRYALKHGFHGFLLNLILYVSIYFLSETDKYCYFGFCSYVIPEELRSLVMSLVRHPVTIILFIFGLLVVGIKITSKWEKTECIKISSFLSGLLLTLGLLYFPHNSPLYIFDNVNKAACFPSPLLLTGRFILIYGLAALVFTFFLLTNEFTFYIKKDSEDQSPNSFDLLSDKPIQSLEEIKKIREYSEDPGVFRTYETLVKSLKNKILSRETYKRHTSVLCIDGEWGAGKTTFLNVVDYEIHNDIENEDNDIHAEELIWFNFDPWSFGNSTELLRDFFNRLKQILWEQYVIQLDSILDEYTELVTPVVESDAMMSKFWKVMSLSNKTHTIKDLKDKLEKELRKIPGKIVVVIDDLDRLEYSEIMTVVKLVRQISDFSNMMFILPFDYAKVEALIEQKRKHTSGDYLQKIITDRLVLEPFSYSEKEAILLAAVGNTFSKKELNDSIRSNIIDVFEHYVFSSSALLAKKHIRMHDSARTENNILKPLFSYILPIYKHFYPEINLTKHYETLETFIVPFLQEQAQGSYTKKMPFLKSFYNILERVARSYLREDINKILDNMKKYSDLSSHIKSAKEKYNSVSDDRNKNAQDLEKELNEQLKEIANIISNIDSACADFDTVEKNSNERMCRHLEKFSYEDELQDTVFIMNWLVSGISPRNIKELSRRLKEQSQSTDTWFNDPSNWKPLVEEVVRQQFGYDISNLN